jgi:tRNA threonylcarbamoyladenosine biosynthesis protein TsaE
MTIKSKYEFTHYCANESEMLRFGGELAAAVENGMVVFLHGPLGAGKTTLTRGFLRGLGYPDKVKSPTYTLVEPYEFNDKKIYHFDLYRIENHSELEHIGIKEYFRSDSICLIEWPEKGFPLLPTADIACYIEIKDDGRNIILKARSDLGEKVLRLLEAKSA